MLELLTSKNTQNRNRSQSVSIVVPVYNEGASFATFWSTLTSKITCPFHVYMIYDFEEDDTLPVSQKIIDAGEQRLTPIRNTVGSGVVGAIITGFNAIETGPVLVVMADLSDDLSDVPKMLELYNRGYDVIAGSRYMKGGRIIGGPFLKQSMSRMAGLTLHWLRGIPTADATNAFKMYDRVMLRNLLIESKAGFELSLEITIKAFLNGYKIAEIPSTWSDRTTGQSKFKLWSWLPSYLKWYFYAFCHRSQKIQ